MPEHTPTPTPSRAVYGFVMYLSFRIFFIIYTIWAVVPEKYFKAVGITFLPQRHWAITVPIFALTALTATAYLIYPGLGLLMTPHFDDMRTITDKIGKKIQRKNIYLSNTVESKRFCVCKDKDSCSQELYKSIQPSFVDNAIPVLTDLNIWEVSDHLHLN